MLRASKAAISSAASAQKCSKVPREGKIVTPDSPPMICLHIGGHGQHIHTRGMQLQTHKPDCFRLNRELALKMAWPLHQITRELGLQGHLGDSHYSMHSREQQRNVCRGTCARCVARGGRRKLSRVRCGDKLTARVTGSVDAGLHLLTPDQTKIFVPDLALQRPKGECIIGTHLEVTAVRMVVWKQQGRRAWE